MGPSTRCTSAAAPLPSSHQSELPRTPRGKEGPAERSSNNRAFGPCRLLDRILSVVRNRFGIAPDAEISLEADPGTFDGAKLERFLSLGVNRLSVGIQSFQQHHLTASGRPHDLAEALEALATVRASGVRSWSLDLISGLPDLRMDEWSESLHRAVEAGPTHVSVYDLQARADSGRGC